MGFWRSLRAWWKWDGNPDTDPFRDRFSAKDDAPVSGDVSGHAHTAAEDEPSEPADEHDD